MNLQRARQPPNPFIRELDQQVHFKLLSSEENATIAQSEDVQERGKLLEARIPLESSKTRAREKHGMEEVLKNKKEYAQRALGNELVRGLFSGRNH